VPSERPEGELVMVRNYYERPCPKWPNGRWLTIANQRVIVDARLIDPTTEYPWQDYPLKDPDGQVLDEPLLHRLVFTLDPDDDDDLGLTWQLIDFQRSAQDCINKMLEYKDRGLNVQMLAPINTLVDTLDDVPGAVKRYKPGPRGEKPEWADAPSGQILNALQQIFNLILSQMQSVGSFQDIQATSSAKPTFASPRAASSTSAASRSKVAFNTTRKCSGSRRSRRCRRSRAATSRRSPRPTSKTSRGSTGSSNASGTARSWTCRPAPSRSPRSTR
jgi:hypothetical protein